MLLCLTGTLCSGRQTVANRLIDVHGFIHINFEDVVEETRRDSHDLRDLVELRSAAAHRTLEIASNGWQSNFAVTGISQLTEILVLRRRPCTVIVAVSAPFLTRFLRYTEKTKDSRYHLSGSSSSMRHLYTIESSFTPDTVACLKDDESKNCPSVSQYATSVSRNSNSEPCGEKSERFDNENQTLSCKQWEGKNVSTLDVGPQHSDETKRNSCGNPQTTCHVVEDSDNPSVCNPLPSATSRLSARLEAACDSLFYHFTGASTSPIATDRQEMLTFAAFDACANYQSEIASTAPCGESNGIYCGDVLDCFEQSDLKIGNDKSSEALFEKVDALPVLAAATIRPNWDTYFMRLAFIASSRSNCIKRRVGAVIVNDMRVLATGYNGTASGTRNCNEGGCNRCKDFSIIPGAQLDSCDCIHAEANAIIELGRRRAIGGVLYSTLMPCLSCAKLIVQAQILRVVFGLSYDGNNAAAELLTRAKVDVLKYSDTKGAARLGAVNLFMPMENC